MTLTKGFDNVLFSILLKVPSDLDPLLTRLSFWSVYTRNIPVIDVTRPKLDGDSVMNAS